METLRKSDLTLGHDYFLSDLALAFRFQTSYDLQIETEWLVTRFGERGQGEDLWRGEQAVLWKVPSSTLQEGGLSKVPSVDCSERKKTTVRCLNVWRGRLINGSQWKKEGLCGDVWKKSSDKNGKWEALWGVCELWGRRLGRNHLCLTLFSSLLSWWGDNFFFMNNILHSSFFYHWMIYLLTPFAF